MSAVHRPTIAWCANFARDTAARLDAGAEAETRGLIAARLRAQAQTCRDLAEAMETAVKEPAQAETDA